MPKLLTNATHLPGKGLNVVVRVAIVQSRVPGVLRVGG